MQAQQLKAEKAALQLAEAEKDKTIAALEADLARYASPPATPASSGPGVGLGGFRGLSVATKSWVDASTNNNAPPPGASSSAGGGGGGGAEEGPGPASDEYTRKLEKAVRLLRERASKAEAKAALLAAMQDPLLSATIGGSKPAPTPAPARRPPSSSSNSSSATVARPLEGNVGGSTRAEIEMLLSDDLMYQVGTLTAQNKALANELKEARKQGAERAAKVRVNTVVQCGVWCVL